MYVTVDGLFHVHIYRLEDNLPSKNSYIDNIIIVNKLQKIVS